MANPIFAPNPLLMMIRSMRIGSRLAVSFSVLLSLLFVVAAVSLSRLSELTTVTQAIVDVQAKRVSLSHDANQHALMAANRLQQLLHTTEREQRIPLYAAMDAEIAASDAAVTAIGMTFQSDEGRAQLERLNSLRNTYDELFRATVEIIELDGPARAHTHFETYTQGALDALLKETSALSERQQHDMQKGLDQLRQAESGARTLIIGLSFGALLTGAALAWIMARSIVSPVREAVQVAETIARGDLGQPVPVGKADEMGQLLRALEVMRDSIVSREAEITAVQDVTIMAMASLAETRDSDTGNHIRRTQFYVKALAEKLQTHDRFAAFLNPRTIEVLFKSAPLHDIGKVGIPDRILLKPGRFEPAEFEIMKTHTTLGRNAIQQAEDQLGMQVEFLNCAKEIAYSHQEKWDGSGYPEGLSGDEIPLSARLMALADVYDALISRRVYKEGMSHEKAVQIIIEGKGTHFDADMVDAFVEIQQEFREIALRFADSDEDLRQKAQHLDTFTATSKD